MTIESLRSTTSFIAGLILLSPAFGADSIQVNGQAVDHASLSVATISRDANLRVHPFDASHADLGKAKHRDTAERAASTVTHLLAIDIVESLRADGFTNVVLDDADAASGNDELQLRGRFTEINPGSQAARAWIGFGAGESKVCVDGEIVNKSGDRLGYFSHCSKGLGWGGSDGQLDKNATRIGESIAMFISDWANGQYGR